MRLPIQTKGNPYLRVFFLAAVTSFAFFLPFLIYDRGIFLFFGDYNVQQIPFYSLAHEAVRNGNIFWNFQTDLGANFIGSYSFYLLGSPFFWLTLPFPNVAVPYLMAPLFILKFSTAAVCAYAFIKRYVKNPDYAIIGALLYAFCGFNVYNIFFNHFNDVTAFFPLMLLALDELVENDRKGVFALSVALMATINYFFFVGQVIFLFAYFLIKVLTGDYKLTFKKFMFLAFESVLGFSLALFLVLPSVLAIMGNPRIDSALYGYDALLYGNSQRYFAIFETFFFPPDLPSRPNFFPDANAKWASLGAYFPLFSMAGVIAFVQSKKNSFIKWTIGVCAVMALVPILNSTFYLLNSSYYARWFYMPLLIMALATAKALEDPEVHLERGIRWTIVITAAFAFTIGILPKTGANENGKLTFFNMPEFKERFWAYVAIAFLSLFLLFVFVKYYREKKTFTKMCISFVCIITVLYSCVYIGTGKQHSYNDAWIIDSGIYGAEKIDLPKDTFYRVDVYDGMDNQAMFWKMPNIQTFHSVVPISIMEFYPSLGVPRDVGSRPDTNCYGLRSLVSVKYLFVEEEKSDPYMPGFEYFTTQNGFRILENKNFIPMGFAYDYYVDKAAFELQSPVYRDRLMLKGIYLDAQQIDTYSKYLSYLPNAQNPMIDEYSYEQDCADRKEMSSYEFSYDNLGFTSKIKLDKPNLVFFSVPYDKGFSAAVNGKAVKVEKVNSGLMAVFCPQGDNVIRFTYQTPGLLLGIGITLVSILVLILYLVLSKKLKKKLVPIGYNSTLDIPIPFLESQTQAEATLQNLLSQSDDSEAVPPQGPSEETPVSELSPDEELEKGKKEVLQMLERLQKERQENNGDEVQ